MKPLFICIDCDIKEKQVNFVGSGDTKNEALQNTSKRTNHPYAAFNIMKNRNEVISEMIIWLNSQGVPIPEAKQILNDLFLILALAWEGTEPI